MPDESSAIDVALQRHIDLLSGMAESLEQGEPIDCNKEIGRLSIEFARLDADFVQDHIAQQAGADERYQWISEEVKQDMEKHLSQEIFAHATS